MLLTVLGDALHAATPFLIAAGTLAVVAVWSSRQQEEVGMADVPSADRRGWGPPCGGRMVTVRPLGMVLPVRAEVAVIFEAFVLEAEAKGCRFNRRRDDWGYNCRHIRNDRSLPWSNHAWGLAVDLDATQNPMAGRLVTTFPGWIDELAERYGLRWGGNYTGRLKDAMHFEFVGTPADARRITERLKAPAKEELSMADVTRILERIEDVETKVEKTFVQVAEKTGTLANELRALRQELAEVRALVQIRPGQDGNPAGDF